MYVHTSIILPTLHSMNPLELRTWSLYCYQTSPTSICPQTEVYVLLGFDNGWQLAGCERLADESAGLKLRTIHLRGMGHSVIFTDQTRLWVGIPKYNQYIASTRIQGEGSNEHHSDRRLRSCENL